MIAHITGTVIEEFKNSLIVDVRGIGYRVYIMGDTALQYKKGSEVSLHTHLSVRETALDLYGFLEYEECEFFEMLIGVSGIGPKSALAILSLASIPTLKQAILENDSSYLTKVSGIGTKNAKKIILELQGKIENDGAGVGSHHSGDVDTIEALKSLGYSAREARAALKNIPPEVTRANDRLKAALKELS
jgi:holliday junction DNA helicase RuvA